MRNGRSSSAVKKCLVKGAIKLGVVFVGSYNHPPLVQALARLRRRLAL